MGNHVGELGWLIRALSLKLSVCADLRAEMVALQNRVERAFAAAMLLYPMYPVTRKRVDDKLAELGQPTLENDHDAIFNTMLTGTPLVRSDPVQMAKPYIAVFNNPLKRGFGRKCPQRLLTEKAEREWSGPTFARIRPASWRPLM